MYPINPTGPGYTATNPETQAMTPNELLTALNISPQAAHKKASKKAPKKKTTPPPPPAVCWLSPQHPAIRLQSPVLATVLVIDIIQCNHCNTLTSAPVGLFEATRISSPSASPDKNEGFDLQTATPTRTIGASNLPRHTTYRRRTTPACPACWLAPGEPKDTQLDLFPIH